MFVDMKKTTFGVDPTLMALVRRWIFNIFPYRACGATRKPAAAVTVH